MYDMTFYVSNMCVLAREGNFSQYARNKQG